MTRMTLRRALVAAALAFLSVVAVLSVARDDAQPAPQITPAANLTQFNPGNIISDQVFSFVNSMSVGDIQNFLVGAETSCAAGSDGSPCLKDYRQDTNTRAADAQCGTYAGASQELASTIIAKVATACGINPRVLLVMLEKEQGLVRGSGLSATRYKKAMGYGCPDTAAGCDSTYFGFHNQVYSAAHQLRRYGMYPDNYNYKAGVTRNILFNPNTGCGSSAVYIQNQATASLYNYTPYQPNAAALRSTNGDSCSAFGNRNFWVYFTDWFGTTQGTDYPTSLSFTKSLYNDVLGRPTNDQEASGWAYQVAGGSPTAAVAQGFINSTERLRAEVAKVYQRALKRDPDPGGYSTWVNYLWAGATLNDLNAMLYGSPESVQALGGGSLQLWVDGMYQGLLGRPAGPSEQASWANVARSQGAASVSWGISASVEARQLRLNGYYLQYLQRPVDNAGISTWLPAMVGRGDLDVQVSIASSLEYWLKAPSRFP
jgi:hypothetical protein